MCFEKSTIVRVKFYEFFENNVEEVMGLFDKFKKKVDERGFYSNGIHSKTDDRYDPAGYDIKGYDRRGYDKSGYDKFGYDVQGFDKDGYNESGYDIEGFNRQGLNFETGTLFDILGFDKNGFHVDTGNELNKDGKNRRALQFISSWRSISKIELECWAMINGYQVKFYNHQIKNADIVFHIDALEGKGDFSRIISGGNFDFIDSDLPQYVFSIKFTHKNFFDLELLIKVIRHAYPKKFTILHSDFSIDAYYVTDNVSKSFAPIMMKHILRNFLRDRTPDVLDEKVGEEIDEENH